MTYKTKKQARDLLFKRLRIDELIDEVIRERKQRKQKKKAGDLSDFIDKGREYIERGIDFIRGARKHASPSVRRFLEKEGDKQIVKMTVCREPVNSHIQTILNTLSFGLYEKAKKELSYDNLYHLYMTITLEDGQEYNLEKNEVVKVSSGRRNGECAEVALTDRLTPNELISRASAIQGESFWEYDARDNNCQVFINNLLNASNINTPELSAYVLQDLPTLLGKLPSYIHPLTKFITDLGARIDVLKEGKGILI